MTSLKNSQKGFHIVEAVIIVAVLAVIGVVGMKVLGNKDKTTNTTTDNTVAENRGATAWPSDGSITWTATDDGGWMSMPYDSKPPACPSPLSFKSPSSDLAKATSVLYPGQSRTGTFEGKGGTYKPHGGIRFDKATDNNISIEMPFDGSVFRGNRVLVDGEIQYGFDIVNACGVMIRLGHLRDLTPAFQEIADALPAATEGDSRTTKIEPAVPFTTGDQIATAIGFKTTKNVGFDFGVYDLRAKNEASKNAAYEAAHADTAELSSYALCWLDLLDGESKTLVKALPAGDQTSGKTSDYCK